MRWIPLMEAVPRRGQVSPCTKRILKISSKAYLDAFGNRISIQFCPIVRRKGVFVGLGTWPVAPGPCSSRSLAEQEFAKTGAPEIMPSASTSNLYSR